MRPMGASPGLKYLLTSEKFSRLIYAALDFILLHVILCNLAMDIHLEAPKRSNLGFRDDPKLRYHMIMEM